MISCDTADAARPWYIPAMYAAGRERMTSWRGWRPITRRAMGLCLLTLVMGGCSERARSSRSTTDPWWRAGPPDELPRMLNTAPPFEYPVSQYLRRLQGNVTLRLFVDATGVVIQDSTRVEVPSGIPAFDSAALAGATQLRFRPALRKGVPIAVAMLYPVHFRYPDGPPTPPDAP